MSNDFPKVKVGNLGYQEDIATATPQKSTGTWENPPGKGETSRNYQFWGSMFVFSSVLSPSPLWHRKRSPRGVAFGCSTRCAKSTNFGCECGSIGSWRRERKQHILVNAVNAKVGWMIDWMKDGIFMDIFRMNERDIISYVKFVNEPVAMLRCVASGLIITSPSPVLAKMQRLLSKHSFFRDRHDDWKLNNQVNPLNYFCCGERLTWTWISHKIRKEGKKP